MASFGIIGTTRRETTRSVTGLHKKTDEAFVDLDVVVVVVVVSSFMCVYYATQWLFFLVKNILPASSSVIRDVRGLHERF